MEEKRSPQLNPSAVVFSNIDPDTLADEWSMRIAERMRGMNFPDEEISELTQVIRSFAKTATELIRAEPWIKVPYSSELYPLNDALAHQILDLFLRGVNQTTKRLRDTGEDWDTRRPKIEKLALKIFNLAKLLVGLKCVPNPSFTGLLEQERDLKIMMKHSTEELIRNELEPE